MEDRLGQGLKSRLLVNMGRDVKKGEKVQHLVHKAVSWSGGGCTEALVPSSDDRRCLRHSALLMLGVSLVRWVLKVSRRERSKASVIFFSR